MGKKGTKPGESAGWIGARGAQDLACLTHCLQPAASGVTGNLMETPGLGLPGGPMVKNPAASAGDTASVPGSGRCHRPRGNEVCACHNSQSLSSRSLCFAMRRPRTATREHPLLVETRESPHVAKKIQRSPLLPKKCLIKEKKTEMQSLGPIPGFQNQELWGQVPRLVLFAFDVIFQSKQNLYTVQHTSLSA